MATEKKFSVIFVIHLLAYININITYIYQLNIILLLIKFIKTNQNIVSH